VGEQERHLLAHQQEPLEGHDTENGNRPARAQESTAVPQNNEESESDDQDGDDPDAAQGLNDGGGNLLRF
jgi:hypothetical protein